MITVRCVGHIATAVGKKELVLERDGVDSAQLVDELRALTGRPDPGFTRYNTLVMVEDGEAFVPASGGRRLKSGDRVVLIPFSHGG